jgi:anti-sigma B factor antagonist
MSGPERDESRQHAVALVDIERFEHEGVRLVTVAGELDISNVGALEEAAFDLPNEWLGVVLDLSAATYIDSSTLGLLFKLQHSLQRRGQALSVVCTPGSSARRVLELTGFGRQFACQANRDDAIAAIREAVPLADSAALVNEQPSDGGR